MKKTNVLCFMKKAAAGFLTAAVCVTSLPTGGLQSVEAAGTPAERNDPSIVYFVDCGDFTPDTVCDGDQLGTHNSVTDQVYGEDPVTGYQWGIVDVETEYEDKKPSDKIQTNYPQPSTAPQNGGVYTANTWAMEDMSKVDQTKKSGTNRYTKNFFEKGIDERFLEYKFELEKGKYEVTICCTDPWGCSKSPNAYLNYGKDSQVTVKEGMEASAQKPAKKVVEVTEDGELTVDLRAEGGDNLAINLAYILITTYKEPSQDELIKNVRKDYTALYLNNTEFKSDITLPIEGENGTTITWSSSNEVAISPAGKVTRPKAGMADTPVTLTAKVSYGDFSMTKKFQVKVLAESDMKDLQEFAYADVAVTDDYYNQVTEADVEFLNKFDPDRLLYNFRLTAGYKAAEIKTKDVHNNGTGATKPYPGGWENSRIGGHTLGHYLAGAAQAVANGYGQEIGEDGLTLEDRLEYLITELKDCQDKLKTGFIFGATLADVNDPERQFNTLERGSTSDTWVPWYTMHKIINGLVETYKLTGNETALTVAEGLGEWVYTRTSKWNTTIQNRVLEVEYGGMNDCLYELYKYAKINDYSDAEDFVEAAHWFDQTELFDRVLNGESNVLDGKHANCTIPKFMGALNRYRALENDEDKYLQYAEAFWTLITEKHTYITGGNSECEFFGADNILDLERSHCNNETCNTHNMLKLTRELYRITGDKKYADYYENTFINAIMASANAETGMTTYFQPMATGYFKVYCNPDLEKNYFWCCTGTGLENFTKLGDSFYYYTGNKLIVNQYTSSNVTWKEKGITLKQVTNIPETDNATFTVQSNGSAAFDLRLRVPDWTKGAPTVKVNGTVQNVTVSNGYISLNRTWKNNDKVELTLPMGIASYTLPDNAGVTYGFKYGPIVLAAELGLDNERGVYQIGVQCDVCKTKIVNGQKRTTNAGYGGTSNQGTLSSETLNVTAEDTVADYIENIEKHLVKDSNSLTFTLTGTDWGGEEALKFTPYYKITDQRYGIYWLFQDDPEVIAQLVAASKEAGRNANVNLSGVGIGYGSQTEGDKDKDIYPCLAEEGNGSVGDMGNLTRYAKAGGSFSYLFKIDKSKKDYIICQYSKADNGKTMVIKVGDVVIAEDTLNYTGTEEIYSVKYLIPAEAVAKATPYELKNDTTGEVETRDVIRISFSGKEGEDSPSLHKNASTCTEYSHNAGIKKLTSNVGALSMSKTGSDYQLVVPKVTSQVEIKTELEDEFGLLYMDGTLIDDTKAKKIMLGSKDTTINLKVFAEDHETSADYKLFIKFSTLSGLTISPKNKSMSVGESIRLNCTLLSASTIEEKAVSWKSSNPSVADVDQNGNVTAKKQGTAVITVTSKFNNSLKATCTITVNKPSITITGAADLAKGKSLKLKAKLTNLKGTVKWSINSKKYATIKGNGATATLKANKKVGKVKVTAQVGSIKKTVTVQVVNPVKSMKLNAKSKTLKVKKSFKLKATIAPGNATNKKVTYKSSNKKVATVSSSGKVKAKKKGKATITVTSKSNPKVKKTCKITVK